MEEVLETLLGTNLTRIENVTIEDELILTTNASTSLNSSVEELHASDLIILRQRALHTLGSLSSRIFYLVSFQ